MCSLHPVLELKEAKLIWPCSRDFGVISGKLWALKRLRQACKLNLTVSGHSDSQHEDLCDWARVLTQALQMRNLDTLVLPFLQ